MSSSSAVVASTIGRATPRFRAVWVSSSATISLCIALPGLTKTAIFEAVGTISRSVSIILLANPGTTAARPVMLPPGCDMLWTRPSLSGKEAATNTIGMLAVADSGLRLLVGWGR